MRVVSCQGGESIGSAVLIPIVNIFRLWLRNRPRIFSRLFSLLLRIGLAVWSLIVLGLLRSEQIGKVESRVWGS